MIANVQQADNPQTQTNASQSYYDFGNWRAIFVATSILFPAAAWAQPAPQPTDVPTDGQWLSSVDPDTPLDPLPDLGVEWPEIIAPLPPLPTLPQSEDDPPPPHIAVDAQNGPVSLVDLDVASPTDPVISDSDDLNLLADSEGERRYRVVIDGMTDRTGQRFVERFNQLSVLAQGANSAANGAQLSRRIIEDRRLLEGLLRNYGFYDASLRPELEADGDTTLIRFRLTPGAAYTYGAVNLHGLEGVSADERSRLTAVFGIDPDDAIYADNVINAQQALATDMRETGYPFAVVGTEVVTIDHDFRSGVLDQPVSPGDRLTFGAIIAQDDGLLGARHIQEIARFEPGDIFRQSDVDDLRRALIATGIVGSVDMTPQANADGNQVDLAVAIAPAPLRTIAALLGYGTGEGLRAEVSWQHRNLFPPEGSLLVRGVVGTREQLANIVFRRNNWHARDRILSIQALVANNDVPAFEARTVQISASVERISTLIYQKRWTWAARTELIATDELAFARTINQSVRRRYGIASISGRISLDRSDDLLDPTRGFRASVQVTPEVSWQDDVFGYARVQLDASGYLPVGLRAVLAARLRIGTVAGASLDSIAPSRRFYAGGGSSVRGYGFQAIGPAAPNGDPIGGTGLFEVAAEARIPVWGAFSLVPFVDGGNVYDTGLPSFSDITNLRVGAGVGIRYASNFGPIRVDVGTPINPGPRDGRIAVYVSLGQAF